MSSSTIAYLALGSNLANPVQQLKNARATISAASDVHLIQASSLYASAAWGSDEPQPDYVNAVVAVQTTLSAHALWQLTVRIEQAHGRVRNGARNAARTLDIDLLLYGDLAADTPDLVLPHPRMHQRDFVLTPLVEIAPEALISGHGKALDCLHQIPRTDLRRLTQNSSWS